MAGGSTRGCAGYAGSLIRWASCLGLLVGLLSPAIVLAQDEGRPSDADIFSDIPEDPDVTTPPPLPGETTSDFEATEPAKRRERTMPAADHRRTAATVSARLHADRRAAVLPDAHGISRGYRLQRFGLFDSAAQRLLHRRARQRPLAWLLERTLDHRPHRVGFGDRLPAERALDPDGHRAAALHPDGTAAREMGNRHDLEPDRLPATRQARSSRPLRFPRRRRHGQVPLPARARGA